MGAVTIGSADGGGRAGGLLHGARYLIQLYGIRSFLADIDRDREFWREGSSIAHSLLDWAANDGIADFLAGLGFSDYPNAHKWRLRYQVARKD